MQKPQGNSLTSIDRVVAYLRAEGWSAPKTTVHRAGKNGIFCKKNGEYPKEDVLAYARGHLKQAPAPQSPGKPPASTKKGKPGLQHALTRLRHAEVETHALWLAGMESGQPVSDHFRAWQGALDLLRKSESDLLSHLEKTQKLVKQSEVKKILAKQITSAKSVLLNLPAKLAPSLDQKPWPEIQTALESEIRSALEKLSTK